MPFYSSPEIIAPSFNRGGTAYNAVPSIHCYLRAHSLIAHPVSPPFFNCHIRQLIFILEALFSRLKPDIEEMIRTGATSLASDVLVARVGREFTIGIVRLFSDGFQALNDLVIVFDDEAALLGPSTQSPSCAMFAKRE